VVVAMMKVTEVEMEEGVKVVELQVADNRALTSPVCKSRLDHHSC
jgi:hypothetical protein